MVDGVNVTSKNKFEKMRVSVAFEVALERGIIVIVSRRGPA